MGIMPKFQGFIEPENRLSQGLVESALGGGKGFCMALTIQWIINCNQFAADSPAEEFRSMKAKGLVYFKQLIQSQKAFLSLHELEGPSRSDPTPTKESILMQKVISLMSRGTRGIIPISAYTKSADDLEQQILQVTRDSPNRSCLISLYNYSMGHVIAGTLRKKGNAWEWSLLDVNMGLLSFEPSTLGYIIAALWTSYEVTIASAATVV
jgi:hypothetical protein